MGRAPTSGNCHTCRQRRVKCDKAQPTCQRCVRSGFTCQGYKPVLRMQSHAVVAGAAPGTSRLAKIQTMSSFPARDGGACQATVQAAWKQPRPSQIPRKKTPPEDPGATVRSCNVAQQSQEDAARNSLQQVDELSLAGFLDNIAFSYFFYSYGWINIYSILLQDSAMRSRLDGSGLARDSLRALCYGLLGRDKAAPGVQNAGRRMHGHVIQALRSRITTTSKEGLAELIKPISLMGSYSIVVEQDWRFTHHLGLARILEVCGPEYFQSPDLLSVFESMRWTLISDALVRRQGTFLERPEWQTVPWARCPAAKSATNKLLDVLTAIPSIIQGVWGIMNDRIQWALAGGARIEHPDTVAKLQVRLAAVRAAGEAWRSEWQAEQPDIAPRILSWAFRRVNDDSYRPGISGVQGPDVFDTSLADSLNSGLFSEDGADASCLWESHENGPPLATLMQDAAMYTTVLVWVTRLGRYLAGAAHSPTAIDFFSVPFYSSCNCFDAVPRQPCKNMAPLEVRPEADPSMRWNAPTCRIAVAPVRFSPEYLNPKTPSSSPPPAEFLDRGCTTLDPAVLLPGDVRFAAQLRILSWLCARLPTTRGHVLGTLAAIGLGHCAHDVRPADGIAEVAMVAVGRVFDSTGFDEATDIFLRSYQPTVV